jgi:hypothetical protein
MAAELHSAAWDASRVSHGRVIGQSRAQGPGPPQRSQIPGVEVEEEALDCSAPTAKTLSVRTVRVDPHPGHGTFVSCWPMLRSSFSNLWLQLLQVYS